MDGVKHPCAFYSTLRFPGNLRSSLRNLVLFINEFKNEEKYERKKMLIASEKGGCLLSFSDFSFLGGLVEMNGRQLVKNKQPP